MEVSSPLLAWQRTDLSVQMTSPKDPGIYESKWRMSTAAGNFFGDTIWVILTVEPAGTLAITQGMNKFNPIGAGSGAMEADMSGAVTPGAAVANPFVAPSFTGVEPAMETHMGGGGVSGAVAPGLAASCTPDEEMD